MFIEDISIKFVVKTPPCKSIFNEVGTFIAESFLYKVALSKNSIDQYIINTTKEIQKLKFNNLSNFGLLIISFCSFILWYVLNE